MTAMGVQEEAAPPDCPCSRFASGERSSELALRCCCVRGVRPGRTDLHRAAADGDVKALTAGLQQLAAQRSTQQAGAPLGADQQPQGGEQQAHEGPVQPADGPQLQPGSSQVSCGAALPPGGSPAHVDSKGHDARGSSPRLELPLDAAGNSPLHVAAAAAQPTAVALLLHYCVPEELERRNCFGLTPLHSLAASPQPGAACEAVLRLLLHAGADPLARTLPPQDAGCDASYDDSALSLVAQHARPGAGAAQLVAALVGAGLDPLEPNGTLWTSPLEYACAAGGGWWCRLGAEELMGGAGKSIGNGFFAAGCCITGGSWPGTTCVWPDCTHAFCAHVWLPLLPFFVYRCCGHAAVPVGGAALAHLPQTRWAAGEWAWHVCWGWHALSRRRATCPFVGRRLVACARYASCSVSASMCLFGSRRHQCPLPAGPGRRAWQH